jgi:hypothetical protein
MPMAHWPKVGNERGGIKKETHAFAGQLAWVESKREALTPLRYRLE